MPSDTPFSQDAEHGYDAINSLYLRYQDLADLEKHKNKVIEVSIQRCDSQASQTAHLATTGLTASLGLGIVVQK